MAELLLELYSEEIPPQLQIGARTQLKELIESSFKDNEIKYKELLVFSSPTRLVLLAVFWLQFEAVMEFLHYKVPIKVLP